MITYPDGHGQAEREDLHAEIAGLRAEVERLKAERNDLDGRLTAACNRAVRDSNDRTGLVNENAALLIRAVEAEAEVERLKAELDRAAPAVALAEAVVARLDAERATARVREGKAGWVEILGRRQDARRAEASATAAYRAARAKEGG